MLTEEEKNRIRLEEAYRNEIRQQLRGSGENKPKPQGIWFLLNSAFFLWFLSTVVLGSLSFIYARWDRNREAQRRDYEQQRLVQRENVLTARKLDAEISSRLTYLAPMMRRLSETNDRGRLRSILIGLEKPSAADYPVNAVPEYANRSFRSLLWELLQVVPEDEKADISDAYVKSNVLYSMYLAVFAAPNSDGNPTPIKEPGSPAESRKTIDIISNLFTVGLACDLERWGRPFGVRK